MYIVKFALKICSASTVDSIVDNFSRAEREMSKRTYINVHT